MNLWEKIRTELHKGAEKTTELVKEGAEIASTRFAYISKLAQLNWEERNIKNSMNAEFTKLGSLLMKLHNDNKLDDLNKQAKPHFDKLKKLEQEIKNSEHNKNELAKSYGMETIDKGIVKSLSHDLEESGGTIMQVQIDEHSQFLNKKLKEVTLPKDALIGTIVRKKEVIIPDGETVFLAGDKITLLGKQEDVEKAIESITGTE